VSLRTPTSPPTRSTAFVGVRYAHPNRCQRRRQRPRRAPSDRPGEPLRCPSPSTSMASPCATRAAKAGCPTPCPTYARPRARAYPEWAIRAIGHTDNIGNQQSNQALSERRAESVRDALVSLGLDENRVSCEDRGDIEPIAPNISSEGRSVNRRGDLLISLGRPPEPAPRAGENGDRPEEP
jgi:hypothetical protein